MYLNLPFLFSVFNIVNVPLVLNVPLPLHAHKLAFPTRSFRPAALLQSYSSTDIFEIFKSTFFTQDSWTTISVDVSFLACAMIHAMNMKPKSKYIY